MSNTSLLAVVFILLIGIFAVLGISARQQGYAFMPDASPAMSNSESAMNKMTVQNN